MVAFVYIVVRLIIEHNKENKVEEDPRKKE